MLVWFKNHAIKLFQRSSIVFDLLNKEQCDGLERLNVIYDATVGLQLRAQWSEVLACFANYWHYMYINCLSKITVVFNVGE